MGEVGTEKKEVGPPIEAELARRLYTTMALAAACDERLRKGIARGEFATVIWPSRGQEAIAAGFGEALRAEDRLVTTYRGLHDLMAKGVPLTQVIGEVLGRTIGASQGKGGTMHISCPEAGVMLTTGIVGAGLPVAVGLALAARQQKSDRVVAVCFGDGATNTGSFHEAMNLASTWALPVVFICQNNQFAEMTPIHETMRVEHVVERAHAYAMASQRVDGNDPEAVYWAVGEAAARGRSGAGPTLLDCSTFRLQGHFSGDPQHYMPKEQLEAATAADPLPKYRERIVQRGDLTVDDVENIDEQAVASVAAALEEVLASPVPEPSAVDEDVFAEMTGVPR
jgi:TPP-dependent pyruvate/acetoin dehydrogenase alpha subunit